MKKCELCESPAKIYCESDQASLCWDCDTKVHGANFLVAKHSRTLLCHLCQSPTPWNGCGPKLSPTISVCNVCVGDSGHMEKGNNGEIRDNDEDDLDGNDDDDDEDVDEDGDEDEDNDDMGDDDEENQVVPRSSTPPPPVSSSSTTGECSSNKFSNGDEDLLDSNLAFSVKRMRQTTMFHR
ncbi:zinc finger protein CONSTANS-LIKE 9-like [Mangifera indica]|uniref:zinc finger protein CONSTANS-LIKE 9-like n=1 Tax=Mangifera indica TaxID=29780 RepID=UPI001CFB5211|nr:zinc finger protein CONSTANS-LIKE 9-like [Mangifera indica]WED40973.1 CONSTANS-like 11 [Mangifera indica]